MLKPTLKQEFAKVYTLKEFFFLNTRSLTVNYWKNIGIFPSFFFWNKELNKHITYLQNNVYSETIRYKVAQKKKLLIPRIIAYATRIKSAQLFHYKETERYVATTTKIKKNKQQQTNCKN